MKRIFLFLLLLLPLPAYAVEVKEVVSKSGIKAWLVEEHALPLVAVRIAFTGSGYAYDPEGREGRANFVSAMLTEGAGDLDSQAFNKALEERAIEFGAACDEDNIYLSLEMLSEHKEAAFSYLGMAATKPRFDSDAIDRTRRQTLSVILQQEESPGYLASRKWLELAFGKHPYAHPQTGFKSSVETLAKSDLQFVREHYMSRENILISAVGDITPDELARLIDTHLSGLAEHYAPETSVPEVEMAAGGSDPVVVDFDIPQTMVTFGLQGIKRDHPDYYVAYVMNQILGGGGALTSRLGLEIRERRGLTYGIGTTLEPMAHGATWHGGMATRNDQVGSALTVFRSTIKDFSAHGPTDKELSDAKQFLVGSFVLNLDSNGDIAKFLISMQLNKLGMDYLKKRNGFMEAVTKEQVARVAKQLIVPDKLLIVMAGKPKLEKAAGK